MHIIIDADPIVYRAGFAAETRNYQVIFELPDGEMEQRYFSKCEESGAGDKKKAFKQAHPDWIVAEDNLVPEVEPLPFALNGVKITMNACLKDARREFINDKGSYDPTQEDVVTVLLSGPGNFRDDIATIQKYKGNRDDAYKPYHYQAIRDYLCDTWHAKIISGHEADDECSILGWMEYEAGNDAVICTIDKDLDQIPLPHYDYSKKAYYTIDEDEGAYIFHMQALCGDSTDHIQGMFKVGAKGAQKLLAAWREEFEKITTKKVWEDFWWKKTVEAYRLNMEKYPEKYPDDITPKNAALENARLVYMQQYRNQLWTPAGMPDEVTT